MYSPAGHIPSGISTLPMPPKEMKITRAASGGFIANHPDTGEDHVATSMENLKTHLSNHFELF